MSETEMGWTCGCGWNNGINLAVCATCGRTPSEGFGVGFDRRAEPATLTDYRAIYERVAAAIGDDRYLDPPDGGSVDVDEQVRRMRVERDRLTAQVAEQAQEIAAKETMIAATDAEAAKALLLLTDAEAKLREQAQEIERLTDCMKRAGLEAFMRNGTPEDVAAHLRSVAIANLEADKRQAQEIERLRREWEDAVERERRLAPSLADTQVMARDAQAKLRAVEALRDALIERDSEARLLLKSYQMELSKRGLSDEDVNRFLLATKSTAILTPEAQ